MDPCCANQGTVFSKVKEFGTHTFNNTTDISCIMKARAKNMYGIQVHVCSKFAIISVYM